MKQKLVVMIAAVLMLALAVSAVSAEDSLSSTIDSISADEENSLMTSDSGNPEITAKVPADLLDDIDDQVDLLYKENEVQKWNISKDQFKIMLAVLAWGEGNPADIKCRYAAHSSDGADVWHKHVPKLFHFSSGLGPFQITATDGWTTIDKLNSKKALEFTINKHKTYSKGTLENLEDVRSKLKGQWYAYEYKNGPDDHGFEESWKEVTGTNWNDVKNTNKETKNSPLNWMEIKNELSDTEEVEDKAIRPIGKKKWTISKGDGVIDHKGDTIDLNKDLDTWLISAKKLPEGNKATSYEYYYTYDDAQKIEIWAYSNPSDTQHDNKSIFVRTYTKPGGWDVQRRPDNDGFTLNHPVFELDEAQGNANVMLVIDRSGSMAGKPISNAKNSAQQFIGHMESEDMAGVVSFSSSARHDYHLTTLTSNDDIKDDINQKISSISASGSTAMGSGLRYGLNDLLNYGDPNDIWAIVLLSDGYHNAGEHPDNVIPSLKDKYIQVYTIGLGSAQEELLGNIANQTGGEYYYAPEPDDLHKIYSDIVAKIIDQDTVYIRTVGMVTGDLESIPVKIDSAVDKASFGISWPGSSVDLVLYKPDGSMVDASIADSDPTIEYSTGSTYRIYKVTDPEPGEWTMELNATDMPAGGEDVYVTVRAKSTLSMLLSADKDQYNQGESVKIIASFNTGTQITEANVEVNITLPDSSVERLTLYDDSVYGDDGTKDGVYANFFSNTYLKGDYRVDAISTGSLSDGSQFNRIEDVSFEIIQGISPISSITNLQSTSDTTWINLTWINPTDLDLSHNEIYLDGVFQTNTSAEYYNITGLEPERDYTIGTRTVDIHGNVNDIWVNSTDKTKAITEETGERRGGKGTGSARIIPAEPAPVLNETQEPESGDDPLKDIRSVDDPSNETGASETEGTDEGNEIPGFQMTFAISGLLAALYLLRKQ